MLSIDTNILLYALNTASPHYGSARQFIQSLTPREDIAISEFVLTEFYVLLRNPVVLEHPLDAPQAANIISAYRKHPRWHVVGFPPESRPIHDRLWKTATEPGFSRRRIFDLRTALILQAFGVREFATANVRDFADLGFQRVWNPVA